MTESRMREVSTFAAVGVAATLTHLLVAWIAHGAGALPQVANIAGWIVAMGVSFLGHARLTFKVGGALAPYLPRFVVVSAVAFIVSAMVVAIAQRAGADFRLALLAVGLTVPPASYIAQKLMVFQGTTPGNDRLTYVSIAFGLAVFLWFRDAPVNHDVAWYLVAGRQWIEGARLYSDLSEVNPPLAFYLIRAALHLGDFFALDPGASLAAFVALMITISLIWVGRTIPDSAPFRALIHLIFALALVVPFLGHFGQREHFMVILIAPWIAAALFHGDPLTGRGACVRSIVAGVGICLKPHFLVYPAALTITEVIRRRSLRPILAPANLAMGCVGLAYLGAVAVVHLEYLSIIVPDARLVYGAVTLPIELQIANISPVWTILAGFVLLAGRQVPHGGRALAFFVAAVAAYVAQGNGFTYHAAPIHALSLIGLAVVAASSGAILSLIAASVIAVFLGQAALDGGYRNPLSGHLAERFEQLQLAPERLLVWSPSLLPAFPLALDLKTEWTGHAASLWLLPGTLDLARAGGDAGDPRQVVLDRQRSFMARDLDRCPDILVLDRVMPFQEEPLDLHLFAGDAVSERLDEGYVLLDRGERFDILQRREACPG